MLPTLHTRRLTLAPFAPADAPFVQRYAGDARIAATTAFIPHPYPDGAASAWIATHLPQFLEKTNMTLAIRSRATGELLGAINLKLTAAENRGELGYWVAVPFWSQGICTEAAARMIRHGFEELALGEIQAHHFLENSASGRVMAKSGMRRNGVIPRAMQKNGRLIDIVQYNITREEYQNAHAGTRPVNQHLPKPQRQTDYPK